MPEPSALLVPTSSMPMTSEIRGVVRYDDEVSHPDIDDA